MSPGRKKWGKVSLCAKTIYNISKKKILDKNENTIGVKLFLQDNKKSNFVGGRKMGERREGFDIKGYRGKRENTA